MSILKIHLNGQWVDVCSIDYRLYKDVAWNKVKGGDSVFVNNAWQKIICSRPFKWIVDPEGTDCEETSLIREFGFEMTPGFYPGGADQYDSSIQPQKAPGFSFVGKKNMLTGSYLFDLHWIEINSAGGGPNIYHVAIPSFSGDPYLAKPIGQMTDPSLYPTADIQINGTGCYGKLLKGKLDTQGRLFITQADEKSITAWNPSDPRFIMRSFNVDHAADFNGANLTVNTGWAINTLLKKVTNDAAELALDDDNELVSISGKPQSKKAIGQEDPNYRTLNTTMCKVPVLSFGNDLVQKEFTRNNCPGGFIGGVVPYVIAANTFYANTKEEANLIAMNAIDQGGQNFANATGSCTQSVFQNVEMTQNFTKNDCPEGQLGGSVAYTVPAGTFSDITQSLANAKAQEAINMNGQANANALGTCTIVNVGNDVQSQNFTKNDCGAGQFGTSVAYVVAADTFFALTKAAANQIALDNIIENGQAYANENGTCSPIDCNLELTFEVEEESTTTATAKVIPTGGTAPYTYLWSNGQTTQTATGLVKNTEYTVQVTDSVTCVKTGAITPDIEVLNGLKIEVMYFENNTIVTTDPYFPRNCVGGHTCNNARYNVLANGILQGDANMNNAGGNVQPDVDTENRAPNYPDYDMPALNDRYWSKTLSGADAAAIADETGKVNISLAYVGTGSPHSSAIWIRISKQGGEVLASTCVDTFTGYEFDPYS